MNSPVPVPPFDRELAAALATVPMPPTLTAEMIPQLRQGPAVAPPLAQTLEARSIAHQDVIRLRAETTAKWLHETTKGRARLRAGQLVIVDEATLAGTRTLTTLADAAHTAGAKLLLVGDPAQLQAVDAGGAFRLLVAARTDTPALTDIHRFVHMWEKEASKALRAGLPEAVAAYDDHSRLHEGTHDEALDAAYTAWANDLQDGRASVLIADATATVTDLNRRARADRILAGLVDPTRAVVLADGTEASAGDIVITRHNARHLTTLRGGFVRNGDRWQITGVRRDGAVEARRLKSTAGRVRLGSTTVLPARYVADHLDLGYAVTAHRAQGLTVDTGHVVVTATTARENLYVALTRGRHANHAYVAVDLPDGDHTPPPEAATARAILYRVLARTGAELSAHETQRAEHEKWASHERLVAEYEHLADHAQRPRWTRLVLGTLTGAGRLTEDEAAAAITTDAFGPLCRELRRAEAFGHDVERVLPAVAARGTLLGADDICAVLKHRLSRATSKPVSGSVRVLPGGIAQATGLPADERSALDARARLVSPLPEPIVRATPAATAGPSL